MMSLNIFTLPFAYISNTQIFLNINIIIYNTILEILTCYLGLSLFSTLQWNLIKDQVGMFFGNLNNQVIYDVEIIGCTTHIIINSSLPTNVDMYSVY